MNDKRLTDEQVRELADWALTTTWLDMTRAVEVGQVCNDLLASRARIAEATKEIMRLHRHILQALRYLSALESQKLCENEASALSKALVALTDALDGIS